MHAYPAKSPSGTSIYDGHFFSTDNGRTLTSCPYRKSRNQLTLGNHCWLSHAVVLMPVLQPCSLVLLYQAASLPALAVFFGFSRTVRKQHIAHLHVVNASEYNYGPKWAESLISDDDVGIRAHIQQEPKPSKTPWGSVVRSELNCCLYSIRRRSCRRRLLRRCTRRHKTFTSLSSAHVVVWKRIIISGCLIVFFVVMEVRARLHV